MDAVRPRVCEEYHLLTTNVKRAVEVREISDAIWACHDKAHAIVLTCLWPISIDRIILLLKILLTHGSYLKYSFLSSLSASRFASGNMSFHRLQVGDKRIGDKQIEKRTGNEAGRNAGMLLLQASCSLQWSSSFAPGSFVLTQNSSKVSFICISARYNLLALGQKTRINRKAPAVVERALLQVRSEQQPQGTTNSANKSWWFPCLLTQSPFSCARFFYMMGLTWIMQASNRAIDSGGFSSLCKRQKYSVAIQKDLENHILHHRASPHPPLFVLASCRTCWPVVLRWNYRHPASSLQCMLHGIWLRNRKQVIQSVGMARTDRVLSICRTKPRILQKPGLLLFKGQPFVFRLEQPSSDTGFGIARFIHPLGVHDLTKTGNREQAQTYMCRWRVFAARVWQNGT